MPSLPSCAAAALLSLAALTNVVLLAGAAAAFDAGKLGQDAASAHCRKFAAARADLPAGTRLHVRGPGAALDAGAHAIVDVFAAALHECLTTGNDRDLPGLAPGYVRQVAEGFRNRFTAEDNRDLTRVRAHLVEWWTGLADDVQFALARYALAPHIVVADATTPLVVGDFPPGFDHEALAAKERWRIVKDYGGGAVLFRAEP